MAVWKCDECGAVIEGRCKPGKCKTCGAEKDKLIKEVVEGEKRAQRKSHSVKNNNRPLRYFFGEV